MTIYYGRARQQININRKQVGLKMAGCVSGIGRSRWMARYIKTRVNCNSRVGCVDANGVKTGLLQTIDVAGEVTCVPNPGYLLIAKAPRSRGCAGGVHLLGHSQHLCR